MLDVDNAVPATETKLRLALRSRGLAASDEDIAIVGRHYAELDKRLAELHVRVNDSDQHSRQGRRQRLWTTRETLARNIGSSEADEPPYYMSARDLVRAYQSHQLSPVEVTRRVVDRIGELDGALKAYVSVLAETALADAKASQERYLRSQPIGPLDGIPVALKDLFDIKGVETTGGSRAFAGRIPNADATVVRRLRESGAIIIGKVALDELGVGRTKGNSAIPRNPWNSDAGPGGSSSGSAVAVAAGLCTIALGTDTGGSVRAPAARCGVVGLKPSRGLISLVGCLPLSTTLDHVGVLARSPEDSATALEVLTSLGDRKPSTIRPSEFRAAETLDQARRVFRIGVPRDFVESMPNLNDEVRTAFYRAADYFALSGHRVLLVDLPQVDIEPAIYGAIVNAEALAFYQSAAVRSPTKFEPTTYRRLLVGAPLTATDYFDALRGRDLFRDAIGTLMRSIDVIVLPTNADEEWINDEEPALPGWTLPSFRHPFNVTGQPAVTVRAGFTSRGLPIGIQLIGREFEDELVLALASRFEGDHAWRGFHPQIGPDSD